MRKKGFYSLVFSSVLVFAITFLSLCSSQRESETWFKRVLITNDDGIDSPGIIELARAFSEVAETYVVAPNQNKSGSSDYMSAISTGMLKVEKRNMGERIQAYAVDGFPGDCCMIALGGIMLDNPPDLVISGINTGPNYGEAWIASGTVGAARVASFAGFPAIAVSGVDDEIPGALEAASRWVVRLAQSPALRELEKFRYLTVDIPNVQPSEIQGIRTAQRAGLQGLFTFHKADNPPGDEGNGQVIWRMTGRGETKAPILNDSDIALYRAGYIVIVPMKADEHDYLLLEEFQQNLSQFPPWEK